MANPCCGPEFISTALAEWAEDHRIDLDFIQPGKPAQNSYVERFNRTYRDEVLVILPKSSSMPFVPCRWRSYMAANYVQP